MPYGLRFTPEASSILKDLAAPQFSKKLKKVNRALGLLQNDPGYPGLHSHKLQSVKGQDGEAIWDSYVENHTPSAWRILWRYGPGDSIITVLTIGPHP